MATEQQRQKFRSVLPHEPLPSGNIGHIHLQGALEPKKKKQEGETDDSYYWTKETLETALTEALSCNYKYLQLPHPATAVQVLDPTAPFTKIRLTYASPQQALTVVAAWRALKVSPRHLFPQTEINFGSHTCQVTMITTTPLPANSWTRSNPPKFRRLLHDHTDSEERSTTRFLFVTGLLENPNPENPKFWKDSQAVLACIRQVFDAFDSTNTRVEVFLSKKQQLTLSCHVGMRSAADVQQVMQSLQGQSVVWDCQGERMSSGTLFLDYASVTQRSLNKSKAKDNGEDYKGEASRPECTSATDHVQIPGLVVLENFISEAEEEVLLATLTGPHAPWAPDQTNKSQTGAVKRLVQHYGYVFDYQTADVLRDRDETGANCPTMPGMEKDESNTDNLIQNGLGWDVMAAVVDRTRKQEFSISEDAPTVSYPNLNQLTVNHYKPGEGIGSHVDTPPAFGDGLISLSLNGGIVMEFRRVGADSVKKLVYLPARSVVLMSGDARYQWEHMIVTRRTDTVNGTVIPRKLRVSLTLRTALDLEGAPLPLVESRDFPPTWAGSAPTNALVTPATEREHVHAVYDAIATQWHHTRGKRGVLWPGARQFLERLPPGSIVADCGCGDGKYFPAILEAGSYVIGTDISMPLLQTAFGKGEKIADTCKVSAHRESLRDRPAVAVADCMSLPLRSDSCDAAICIAVMHHLSTLERRVRCIEELVRVVREGGTINIQAWALEQDQNSRRRFASTDIFVPFNAQPKYLEKVQGTTGGFESTTSATKSVAEMYSEKYKKADFDEKKGLVVFQRYCHMYRTGELEELVQQVPGAVLLESGYESGNYFAILKVEKC
jgi:alkylated DNA repair dioxygenase AlkB/SAM-dependent methyltransferase